MTRKNRFFTFLLSFVPGLGHFYLGLNRRGLQFMVGAFACIVLIPLFPTVFPFALTILWFYCLFDALQRAAVINSHVLGAGIPSLDENTALASGLSLQYLDDSVISLGDSKDKQSRMPVWFGGLCVFVGVLVLLRRVFPGLWSTLLQAHAGTFLVALALIGFGVWLIVTQTKRNK